MLLIEPTLEYAKDIEAYRQEFLDIEGSMDGCGSLRRCATGAEWIEKSLQGKDPKYVAEGRVPATQFVYVREEDGRVVGMLQLRHCFNPYLEKYAGHIGYSVRPSERRRGVAKWMLAAILPHCRGLGLDRVMIACEPWNEGSRRTILANGGVYEKTVHEPERGIDLEQYWITL